MTPEIPIPSTPLPAEATEPTVNYCDVRGYSVRLATPEELMRPAQAIYSEQTGSEFPRDGKEMKTVDLTFLLDGAEQERCLSDWSAKRPEYQFDYFATKHHPNWIARATFRARINSRSMTDPSDLIIQSCEVGYRHTRTQPVLVIETKNGHTKDFPLNAVPIASPFKKKELAKIWDDFISLFLVSERSEIHDLTDYDS